LLDSLLQENSKSVEHEHLNSEHEQFSFHLHAAQDGIFAGESD